MSIDALVSVGIAIVTAVLTGVAIGLLVLALYLVGLSAAAVFGRPSGRLAAGSGRRRFAILVPAHDEERVIGRLLRSLRQLDYAPDRFEVCVVADNCSDATAAISRALAATVFERTDTTERAKGFALRWLLAQLRQSGRSFDAYVVLDADSVVDRNLLRCLDARLEAGSRVVQVYYTVLNADASSLAGLRFAALAALHYLRPLGRAVLGLSCGLKGNGMCFAAAVLEQFGWDWFTLAEDVEFHLALIRAGIRVDFAHETSVLADMPVTLAQAASQNHRWERGRLDLLRGQVPRVLADGLKLRSALRIDAALEQLIPPLSVPFALGTLCLVGALVLGAWPTAALAAVGLMGQMAYLAVGLALVKAPWRTYLALSSAPIYIAWKVGLYAQALVSGGASAWIRTARVPD